MAHNPDERAARFRNALPEAMRNRAKFPNDYDALLNCAEALMNAARCSNCAHFERGKCKANPPVTNIALGEPVAVWPTVHPDDWCSSWRSA